MSSYDDRESWLTAMIKGREKSQIGRKNPPLTNTELWGLLLVIGPNIQHPSGIALSLGNSAIARK
jgi:hypothetical protein